MSIIPRNYFLDDFFGDLVPSRDNNKMKCDIYEKDGDYHIEMDIPGFDKKDISIEAKDGYLTIRAEKTNEENEEDKNYIRRERTYGSYERSFYLGDLDDEQIEAEFKDGMLKITVPKKNEQENKKVIEIK